MSYYKKEKLHETKIPYLINYITFHLLGACATISAAEYQSTTPDLLSPVINDNQIVEALPEGGFIYNLNGSSTFDSTIVSNNQGKLMSYKQYKDTEIPNKGMVDYINPPILVRSASPYRATNNPKILPLGQSYRFQAFSGSGWRFSELKFEAVQGTGTWLFWESVGDSDLVGNEYEAYRTYESKKPVSRAVIGNGQGKYVNGEGSWLFFYTHNPVNGSWYRVTNK